MNHKDVLRHHAGTGYLRMVINNPDADPVSKGLCQEVLKERTTPFFLDKEGVKHYF